MAMDLTRLPLRGKGGAFADQDVRILGWEGSDAAEYEKKARR